MQNKVDILTAIKEVNTSGIKKIKVKGKTSEGEETEEKYIFNVIKHQGDMVLDGNSEYEGATITKTGTEPNITATYQFGDVAQDVATTASNYAQNTVVLKVEGNLTINENVTLTSVANASGFGGPKGMVIYCTGNITNNGTISMTARGAKAVGQNVYLYKNADGNFEYIPAIGGAGAAGQNVSCPGVSGGHGDNGVKPGAVGSRRGTGGGGAGRYIANSYYDHGWQNLSGSAGSGSAGTAFSGGSSGGAYFPGGGLATASAKPNGGAAGTGQTGNANGAGNPSRGTGGLLIMSCSKLEGTGKIESKGSSGTKGTGNSRQFFGGGSGGGSINVFVGEKNYSNELSFDATGGPGNSAGSGGQGAVVVGSIIDGVYSDLDM